MLARKNDTLIAIAFTGDHIKMRQGQLNPFDHQQMLLETIQNINPDNEFDVLVSCNKHNIMEIADEKERLDMWRVYALATVLSLRENNGHQMGQALAIRLALEYAKARNFKYLYWSGDDILYDDPFIVRDSIALMNKNKSYYIGRHWGTTQELDCQVFGCNVDILLKLFRPEDFASRGGIIETYMHDILRNSPVTIHLIHHHHEHDPNKFMSLLPHVKEQFARRRGTPVISRRPSRIGMPSYRV